MSVWRLGDKDSIEKVQNVKTLRTRMLYKPCFGNTNIPSKMLAQSGMLMKSRGFFHQQPLEFLICNCCLNG